MEKKKTIVATLLALLPFLVFGQEFETVVVQGQKGNSAGQVTASDKSQAAFLSPFSPIAASQEVAKGSGLNVNLAAAHSVPSARVESSADTTEIWGHIITKYGDITRPSIVKFSASPSTTYKLLWTDQVSNLFASSTFCEDYIHLAEVYMNGTRCIEHKTSTKTWTEVSHTDRIHSCDIQSTCSAWDPQTRLVYGQFYANNYDSVEFATVDFEHIQSTGGRTAIRTVHTDGSDTIFVALAFNDGGQLYSVTNGGSFMRVNKNTGIGTVVGTIGFIPTANLQAMAYDKKNSRFLWNGIRKVVVSADSTAYVSSLYSIDPATGHATKLYDMPGNAEFISLYVPYTPDAQAPDTVKSLSTSFEKGSSTGTVSFTLPNKTAGGNDLSGSLHWTLKAGTETIANGNAEAGASVTTQVTIPTGYATFFVSVSNSAGEGKAVHTDNVWFGFDIPKPVTATSLTINGNTGVVNLTWTKPDEGIHGGYIGDLTYNLKEYPTGNVINGVSGTSYTTTVSGDVLTAYYYDIVPVSQVNEAGEGVRTVRKWFGSYVEIPYKETFQDAASLEAWFVTGSGNSLWQWDSYVPDYMSSTAPSFHAASTGGNNAWLMSPYLNLKSDRKYVISFETTVPLNPNSSTIDYQHTFNLYFGKSRSTSNTLLAGSIKQTTLTNQVLNSKYVVAPDTDGKYCFAIQDITPKTSFSGDIYFDNFKVETYALYVAPDSCRNFSIIPAERGELSATITFTTPTRTMEGKELASLTGAYIVRDDSVVVKHFDAATPGQVLTAVDTTVPTDGLHKYTVYATNEAGGEGVKFDSTVYVGVDIPLQPRPLKLINNGDGTGVYQWAEPSETGVNGGYVNPSDLTYNLYYLSGSNPVLVRSGITANYADVTIPKTGAQSRLYYLVSAVSRAGEGQLVISPYTLRGAPYEAPFKESFADYNISTTPWIAIAYDNNNFQLTNETTYDGDGGALYYTNVSGGHGLCTLFSPKISLENCVQPSIKLNYYARPKRNIKFRIGIEKPDQDIVYLDTINFNTMTGSAKWLEAKESLSRFKDQPYVRIVVDVENKLVGTQFIIDNIRLENEFDKNLELHLHTPAITHRGNNIKAIATVKNSGNSDISGYDIVVSADGTEFARQHIGTTLKADSSATISFDYNISATAADSIVFDGEVVTATDDYAADNTYQRITAVKASEFVPTVLGGQKSGNVVSLSWKEPANTDARVTEDWESTTPFTRDDFSPWTVYDGDGMQTYYPAYFSYPGMGRPIAFVCLDNSQIDKIDQYTQYKAHSGNQYLADFLTLNTASSTVTIPNNDWLISPRLSGKAQTVRVFVKQPEEDAGLEEFEFRWSNTDNSINSFTQRLNDTIYNAIPGMWGYLDAPVPNGTNYFAIRVRSKVANHFMFMIDDITYTRGGLKPVAYNVYRNGRLVGTVNADDVASGNYSYTITETEPNEYNVTVVYDDGESPLSNTFSTAPTGISTVVSDNNWTVNVRDGQFYINGLEGQNVIVADVGGAVYYRGTAKGQLRIDVPAGVYVVCVGKTAKKIVIK